MFVSIHAVFLEKEFILGDSGSKTELEEVQETQINTKMKPKPISNASDAQTKAPTTQLFK